MTRQVRRHKDFEVSLEISDPDFIRPPRDAQRRWLLNRVLGELVWELEHLDGVASGMVAGAEGVLQDDRTQGELSDAEIMEDWQIPIMAAMAQAASRTGGDVLEIGFGRGISAEMIQNRGVRSHTVVECNDSVVKRFHEWRARRPDEDIRLIHGTWQDSVEQMEQYDGLFFHTYPLNAQEAIDLVARSVTFAEHFFPTAAKHLRPGGTFTYLTNEIDSLSRSHQRLLLRYFSKFSLEVVDALSIPPDSRDDLWGRSMVVVEAVR